MSSRPIEVRAKCPRCETKFTAEVGPDGFFLCPGCGARLRHRRPAPTTRPQVTAKLKAVVAEASASRERSTESATETLPNAPRTPTGNASESAPEQVAAPEPAPPIPEIEEATPGPPSPTASGHAPTSEAAPAAGDSSALEETVPRSLEELMLALYETQQEILGILHTHLVGTPAESTPSGGPNQAEDDEVTALPPAPTRARHRKTVLLVDDDAQSLRAAKEALEHAQIPVVCVSDGDAALAAIAAEKPDLIALEGEMGGALTGRDLVDRVMASMEWINIPIVLYTRAPLESQDEARTTYSADAYVLKGPQGPTALVSQVITTFRKR